jgi:hypothetical protein
MENSGDKIVRMDRSSRFGGWRSTTVDYRSQHREPHDQPGGSTTISSKRCLATLLIQAGAPGQDTLDIITQVLPHTGSAERAWS